MPYPWKHRSQKTELSWTTVYPPCSYMAKRVFNIRFTHFQHLDIQSLGFIPDINRILTKYALHHVLDSYLSDEAFPSKCAWKRIIYEKTIQRSNFFVNVLRTIHTCAPLILRSDGVSCIWTMTRHCQELSSICKRTMRIIGRVVMPKYRNTCSLCNRVNSDRSSTTSYFAMQ